MPPRNWSGVHGIADDDAKRRARLNTLRGRRSNAPLRAWVAEMKPIYKKLTGKNPRISVDACGKPAGPFWRFLKVASLPLAIDGKKLASGVRDQTSSLAMTAPDSQPLIVTQITFRSVPPIGVVEACGS
jgi:hypothetical protein